jgi:transcriptional regulator with XRE-family HTH domain
MAHWTTTNDEAFINRITFDFIAQLENRLATSGMTQSELARKMNVTEGEVSQVLNLSRMNLNLKTMARYARALGMKVAVVAYDDNDPQNERGPVGSEIFTTSWEKIGKPRDVWSVSENIQAVASTYWSSGSFQYVQPMLMRIGWTNSTSDSMHDTVGHMALLTDHAKITSTEKGSTAYARD